MRIFSAETVTAGWYGVHLLADVGQIKRFFQPRRCCRRSPPLLIMVVKKLPQVARGAETPRPLKAFFRWQPQIAREALVANDHPPEVYLRCHLSDGTTILV